MAEQPTTELTADEKELRAYWNDKLESFERVLFPVFAARGIGKNTALTAVVVDDLESTILNAIDTSEPNNA